MGKEKIDELFQERFKDFEQVPDEKVWQAIEASLEKKKKRIIPLWWKLGGVAAVLLIGLLAINPFTDSTQGKPAITEVEEKLSDSINSENINRKKILNTEDANENQLTDSNSQETLEDSATDNNADSSQQNSKSPDNNFNSTPNKTNQHDGQLTSSEKEKSATPKTNEIAPKQKGQVVENQNNKKQNSKNRINQEKKIIHEVIVQQTDTKQGDSQKQDKQEIAKKDGENDIPNTKNDLLTDPSATGIAQGQSEKSNDSLNKKKSIYDEIITQEELALAEKEAKNKWSAGPSIAPVYYDAFGEGSPVHSILVPNSKSGNTNLSYGLSVAYEINDRFSVRSGIHRVDYGYDTGEIEFSSSLDGAITDQMENIDYARTARNLVVKSSASSTPVGVNSQDNTSVDALVNSNARTGSMSQQFGYLEVPLELNYALIDKKIGINLIGGFSSLFLIDNSVSLTDGNQTTQMGEANNVNDLNFSTNIGLGIDYDFSPKIKLNIEPVFKYQLNTFSEVDGTFNPFSIGIYSGLTFRF